MQQRLVDFRICWSNLTSAFVYYPMNIKYHQQGITFYHRQQTKNVNADLQTLPRRIYSHFERLVAIEQSLSTQCCTWQDMDHRLEFQLERFRMPFHYRAECFCCPTYKLENPDRQHLRKRVNFITFHLLSLTKKENNSNQSDSTLFHRYHVQWIDRTIWHSSWISMARWPDNCRTERYQCISASVSFDSCMYLNEGFDHLWVEKFVVILFLLLLDYN